MNMCICELWFNFKCAWRKKSEIGKNIHAAKSMIGQGDCQPNKAIHSWGRGYAMHTPFLTDEIQLHTNTVHYFNSHNGQ